jgi:hypothetical protein
VVEGDGLYLVDVRSRRKHLVFSPAVPDEAENAAVTWAPDSSAGRVLLRTCAATRDSSASMSSRPPGMSSAHVAGASDPACHPMVDGSPTSVEMRVFGRWIGPAGTSREWSHGLSQPTRDGLETAARSPSSGARPT